MMVAGWHTFANTLATPHFQDYAALVIIVSKTGEAKMLVCMAVFDNFENQRTDMTRRTLESLAETVDWHKHRLIVSDNGSCDSTQFVYEMTRTNFPHMPFTVIKNGENLGTARAINRGWSYRVPGEHCLKMDNDCVIHHKGWADEMEEAFARDPTLGIVGLKRVDLEERPDHHISHYQSTLRMLPHQPGQRWIVVEEVNHCLGTCQSYSSALLDKIGFLYQGQDEGVIYAFDDSLASFRARLAGFKVVFLPSILIDHIDPGGTSYTTWKQKVAGDRMGASGGENWLNRVMMEYRTGKRPIYWKDK